MAGMQLPQVKYDLIRLAGGLDQVTPTLSLKPGVARDAVNYEVSITGGYSRIAGYERFDGRASPSEATYGSITVNLSAAVAVGQTIVGASSGATAVVIAVSGNVLIYTKASTVFQVGENITVSAVVKGSVTSLFGAPATLAMVAQYTALAANVYRADIAVVPGAGPVRGVAYFKGKVYAWRNSSDATELRMYVSSTSGWTQVDLGQQLSFSAGTIELVEGNTVTGHPSGATGVIKRVALESGTWTGGDAAGRLIFATTSGTFTASDDLRIGSTKHAECDSAATDITLLPGGRVETVIATFGGQNSVRLYGCDGVNKAFEFDGEVYAPIITGMPTDAPNHIIVHKQHLFLSFASSVQFSSINEPFRWSPVFGAGEIALTETTTLFLLQPGDQSTGALAIYTNNTTSILYGSSSEDFKLVSYNVGTGAKSYSGQNIAQSYTFDDRGVINLQTTLNFGNFDSAALTLNIRPFIQQRRNLVTASGVNREKGQYRVFFSDGYGLYMTVVNNQMAGCMPVQFPNAVTCMCEGEQPDGSETSFFGSTNGYVYRLDTGTSFDGVAIRADMTLVFNAIGSPRVLKRFRRASLEVTGSGYSVIDFTYDLGYASTEYEQPVLRNYAINLSASFWDSAVWDTFIWDGRTLAPTDVEVNGTAENIAIRISSNSDAYQPFTINSVILHYTLRRGLR